MHHLTDASDIEVCLTSRAHLTFTPLEHLFWDTSDLKNEFHYTLASHFTQFARKKSSSLLLEVRVGADVE